MTAYQSAVYHDLLERINKGEALTPDEQRRFCTLDAQARKDWEAKPQAHWYGGHPDMF